MFGTIRAPDTIAMTLMLWPAAEPFPLPVSHAAVSPRDASGWNNAHTIREEHASNS